MTARTQPCPTPWQYQGHESAQPGWVVCAVPFLTISTFPSMMDAAAFQPASLSVTDTPGRPAAAARPAAACVPLRATRTTPSRGTVTLAPLTVPPETGIE